MADHAPSPRVRRLAVGLALTLLATAFVAPAASAGPRTKLVSKASNGIPANSAGRPAASDDGKIVAFLTQDRLQDSPDDNSDTDVYARNLAGSKTKVLSRAGASASNDGSFGPRTSTDGRYVSFYSDATNLIDGLSISHTQVYVRDRKLNKTILASVNLPADPAAANCSYADISANGRVVVFRCTGGTTNMYPGDAGNDRAQIIVRNISTGRTHLVSKDGADLPGDGDSGDPRISPDGRFVVFESLATNFTSTDTRGKTQIYLHDRQKDKTKLISKNRNGKAGNESSQDPDISGKGNVIVYDSAATNLAGKDTNGASDIFRYRRGLSPRKRTDRVSLNWRNREVKGEAEEVSISHDGRYIAYDSRGRNTIKGGVTTDFSHIYRRDLKLRKLVLVDRNGKKVSNGGSERAYITRGGKFVFFQSRGSNLAKSDVELGVYRRGPY